ncbi:MAG: VOC family protein [Rhizobiaceae bacterium]|jgi:catechol 2,3-dioxygenase-like lactoylglutathione lyase family enzyme|nr:VOC family protein [Rhizobiaceae bacterium]
MLEKLSPILPSSDIRSTEAFYRKLGFFSVYQDAEYLLMKREMAEVHFFIKAGHDKWSCDHGAYLRPTNVDALSDEWSVLGLPSVGIPRLETAEDKPWGMRELALVDEDGNLIRAGQEMADG